MSAEEELYNVIFKVKMGIFILGNLIFDGVLIYLLKTGWLDLFDATLLLIFISMLELQITLALWVYTAWRYEQSRPSLELLDDMARRYQDILWLTKPIFDAVRNVREKLEWGFDRNVITVNVKPWWKVWDSRRVFVKIKCGYRHCPWDRKPPFKTCDRCPYGKPVE